MAGVFPQQIIEFLRADRFREVFIHASIAATVLVAFHGVRSERHPLSGFERFESIGDNADVMPALLRVSGRSSAD
jgi:hypothetical protein